MKTTIRTTQRGVTGPACSRCWKRRDICAGCKARWQTEASLVFPLRREAFDSKQIELCLNERAELCYAFVR